LIFRRSTSPSRAAFCTFAVVTSIFSESAVYMKRRRKMAKEKKQGEILG